MPLARVPLRSQPHGCRHPTRFGAWTDDRYKSGRHRDHRTDAFAVPPVCALKLEANSLRMARLSILSEFEDLHRVTKYKPGAIYLLFCVPLGCAVFLFIQYVLKVTLVSRTCGDWQWHFIDWGSPFGASKYCIGDKTAGMPWIYPPWQTYAYLLVIACMVFVTSRLAKEWTRYRGPDPERA